MKVKTLYISIMLVLGFSGSAQPQNSDFPVLKGHYLGQTPPDDKPLLFAPGIISTGKEHSAAMFSPDGSEIWFGRLQPEKIYTMKRVENRWMPPDIAPFCDNFKYLYPVLTRDGRRIFFTSDRPIKQNDRHRARGQGDLWMVERTSDGWSGKVHLDDHLNFSIMNSCGSQAADGTLYFSAKVKNRSHDIFLSRLIDGSFSAPESLDGINSVAPEHCPFIALDESYLIFASFHHSLGRSDLFISFRDQDGNWGKPKNMGSKINSAYKDEYPYVTLDGKYLFFNSNRPSALNQKPIEEGPGNIYWVDAAIIEDFRTHK